MNTQAKKSPDFIVYHVTPGVEGAKANWNRVGAAWRNRRGGYQIKLSTVPTTHKFVLLPPRSEQSTGNGEGAA